MKFYHRFLLFRFLFILHIILNKTKFDYLNLINSLFFQTSTEETPLLENMDKNSEELANASSEIFDSDLGENPEEEMEDENEDIDDLQLFV